MGKTQPSAPLAACKTARATRGHRFAAVLVGSPVKIREAVRLPSKEEKARAWGKRSNGAIAHLFHACNKSR